MPAQHVRDFLTVDKGRLVEGKDPIALRGVNLGGWLLWEGYLLHSPNVGVHRFFRSFAREKGRKALETLIHDFTRSFIQASDFKRIAQWGMNVVRIPFHYRVIESAPYRYEAEGLRWLDRAVRWAGQNRLRVILDLHAAPGAQSHDWHADSDGRALFWEKTSFRKRALALWAFLADRYKKNPTVAGFDVLNEPVLSRRKIRFLNEFYREVVQVIRETGSPQLVFLEGRQWATLWEGLEDFDDPAWVMSVHFYAPLEITFNLHPGRRFVLTRSNSLLKALKPYAQRAKRTGRPVFVGEFGVNSRRGLDGEDIWLQETLKAFEALDFHWTYWTYKAVKNAYFPDGLYHYTQNPPWVRREGPRYGWDNYAACWPRHRRAMAREWRTEAFDLDTHVLSVIQRFLRQDRKRFGI